MPRDKTASHARVLEAARKEFLEYGYENASMRRIGARADMTAAGLYRHCRDKEDLFRELVGPAVRRIDEWLDTAPAETVSLDNMMRSLVYPRMEQYRLLLMSARGTPYEDFPARLTARLQKRLSGGRTGEGRAEADKRVQYVLLSAYIAALFEPVVRGYSEQEALQCLEAVEALYRASRESGAGEPAAPPDTLQ